MKKSKKSMAIAIAMIVGCLPKNSLAAPKNDSLANEDNSLASKKPESVRGAEQRSKEMSNSTKVSIGLTAGEIIWETIGWFSKIPTPGKGVARAVDWMFSSSKPITTVGELRDAIKNFAAIKKSNTSDEQTKAYKKMLATIYTEYQNCKGKLFLNFHDKQKMEYEGFKVASSIYGYWIPTGEDATPDKKCVFILKPDVVSDFEIRNFLNKIPQWKVLCDAAEKLKREIVIGVGLHEDEDEDEYWFVCKRRLRGYISIGLKSDIKNYNISNFTNGNFSIFDYTFYDDGKKINNVEERFENAGNSKVYVLK